MANGNNRRDLFLQVSGTVDPLRGVLKAGKSALVEFAGNAAKSLEAVEKSLQDLGGANPGATAKRITDSYSAAFREIRRNAQEVLSADSGAGAVQIINANAARQAADAAEQRAAAVRVVAQAAREEAIAQGGTNAALTQYAAAALVAEKEATDYAIALREQANTLSAVEGRMGAIVAPGKRVNEISGQMRAGMQQLSFQLGDVATQLAAGTSPAIVFAQQIGQVTQAIGLMTTKTSGLLAFIGGPFGIGISSALVLLTPWVAKLFEGAEGSDKLKGSTLALVDALSYQKIGTDAARKALDEYNDAQKRADKQTILSKQIALDRADADLKAAEATRERIRALIQAQKLEAQDAPEGQREGQFAILGMLDSQLQQNEADIKRLDEARQNLRREVGENIGKRAADAEFAITESYKDQRQVLAKQLEERKASTAEIARQNYLLDQREKKDLEDLRKNKAAAASADRASTNGTITPAIVGNLLKDAFGGTITSTNGGKHVPGSFHYKNEAVDFVPAGGMASTSKAQIRAMLEAQRIAIKELLGPGDKGHNDHFHVAFGKSRRGQDEVDRRTETAAEREANRRKGFESQLDQAQNAYYQAQLALVDTTEERADVELERLTAAKTQRDNEIAQQVAAGKLTEAEAAKLKALNADTVELQKIAVERREEAKQVQEQQVRLDRLLEMDRGALQLQEGLLEIQGQLATTTKERRRIALELLKLEEAERRAIANRKVASDDPDVRREGRRDLQRIDAEHAGRVQIVEQQTQSPFEAYRESLERAVGDMDEALEGVKVRALQNLEDGLVGLIDGTESVGSAFKKMANSIIADLIRIGIQKLILNAIGGGSIFGFSGGGKIEGFAGGGRISGPGTGTSDSILALVGGRKPILVSNGESIVNAAATRRYWPLIDAMNKGQLPGFATGGLVAPLNYVPRIPSVRAAAHDLAPRRQERLQVDLRAKVEASPLLLAHVEETTVRTVTNSAEPIMAGAEARTRRNLARRPLPGGFG